MEEIISILKRMTEHLEEGRNETDPDAKLAMLDGGIADELIREAKAALAKQFVRGSTWTR